ncbi:GspE/PulE family protein [Candidatus Poribacteria bacterium]
MRRGFSTTLTALLVEDGVITEDEVQEAERTRQQKGDRLEHILVEQDFVKADEILDYSSRILEVTPIHLEGLTIPDNVLELIPGDMAAKYQLIPVAHTLNMLTVAMANPWDIYAIEKIENYTELSVSQVLSSWQDVQEAIRRFYSSSEELLDGYLERIQQDEMLEAVPDELEDEMQSTASLERLSEEKPVVGLVNVILHQAIEKGASDIHIEPHQGKLRVRYRVDGVLEEVNILDKNLHPAIVSRIKIISNMDIAERRQPQDGRLKLRASSGNVSFRVSSLPTVSGEKIVMRIANDSQSVLRLDQLGMSRSTLEEYTQNIQRPYGMLLVTGPTGSGKTSTLYASLSMVNGPDVNVTTIEDPVEHISGEYAQIEIDPKAGRTFGSVLRSILRQDPDIVMVGEIRDFETAELAIQASLTGHLVFSTLHTNDAPSAIARLLDLAVEPFLISASLSCVVAQRLVRVLCTNCRKPYKPSQELVDELELPPGDYNLFKEHGCPACDGKGYRGRVGVYEVMFMNDEIRELVHLRKDLVTIQQAAIKNGMRPLRQAAIIKAMVGVTSVTEAIRATTSV